MKVELSALYAQSQNGGAERSRGVGSESRSKCLLLFGQRLIEPLFIFMIGLPTPTVERPLRLQSVRVDYRDLEEMQSTTTI
jgi:hypothetical protein